MCTMYVLYVLYIYVCDFFTHVVIFYIRYNIYIGLLLQFRFG